MPTVESVTLLENCLDSSQVKEVTLDGPINERLMHALVEDGKLSYYSHFPRPYFRIELAGQYVIQGIINNTSLRVTFSPQATVDTEAHLLNQINSSS